ncbi:unnamed protein product [Prorocentrum cordatum]|uniref:Uncharacterized protein n=1 Tax=Prorocentrum cordatum TaxID=2364126 RepID=A0ABN9WLS8_9DINO|nr:unnamed protein product [Polarella glacialis]
MRQPANHEVAPARQHLLLHQPAQVDQDQAVDLVAGRHRQVAVRREVRKAPHVRGAARQRHLLGDREEQERQTSHLWVATPWAHRCTPIGLVPPASGAHPATPARPAAADATARAGAAEQRQIPGHSPSSNTSVALTICRMLARGASTIPPTRAAPTNSPALARGAPATSPRPAASGEEAGSAFADEMALVRLATVSQTSGSTALSASSASRRPPPSSIAPRGGEE